MKKAIFILGPTAVGKTTLAVEISSKIPSSLISADSVQVYRGVDIISGKDHPKEVPLSLIDVVSPSESFNVKDFVEKVSLEIENSLNKNRVPIIVGGTGFYIDALFGKISTIAIPPNLKLRKKLENDSLEELQNNLKKIDPQKFSKLNNSDVQNPRRLIRAIEVAGLQSSKISVVFSEDEVLIIGLKTSMENLNKRIEVRVNERIKNGALEEAKSLFKNYKNLTSQVKDADGYRQLFDYLLGEISVEEAYKKWGTADYQHAKKQMTYFKKLENIRWFDIEENDYKGKIMKLVRHELGL